MKIERRPDYRAAVLAPDPGDDPDDLEDWIHDEVVRGRQGKKPGEKPDVVLVVLDISGLEDQARWMKAAGPEVPNVNLRVVLGEQGYVVARALKLTAFFDWYASVEQALRGDS